MPITRNVSGVSDDSHHPFDDIESLKSVTRNDNARTQGVSAGDRDASLPVANEGDVLLADRTGEFVNTPLSSVTSQAQGFIGYVTDYYSFNGSNPVQQLEAETFTDLQPQIQQLFDERTSAMKLGSSEGYLPASHGGHGHSTHGANHFSLAGLENGSFCTVRILYKLTPEIDESSSQVRLHFSTNSASQSSGLTEFTIESQSLVMSEGANQGYSDENLISFFIGDTLSGATESEAGSFHVSVKSSVEADLEILGVTLYANV